MATNEATVSHSPYRNEENADRLAFAIRVATEAVRAVGSDNLEIVTFTRGRICLQPTDPSQGERIARALGRDMPLDHRMFTPGHTLWAGVVNGMEVRVRSVLRQVVTR